jgi:hypothetical protein
MPCLVHHLKHPRCVGAPQTENWHVLLCSREAHNTARVFCNNERGTHQQHVRGSHPMVGKERPSRPTTAPPARRKSALDDLRSMIEAGDAVMLEASASQAKLKTVRKLSEGLGEELEAIMAASQAWNSLGSHSGSKVLTDAELRVAFDSIDTDSSGSIEAEELVATIQCANSTLSNTTVAEMMSYADTDGDGRCAR